MDFEGFNLKRAAMAGAVGVAALILMIMVVGRMVHLKTTGRGNNGGVTSGETVSAGENTGKMDHKDASGTASGPDSAGNPGPGNQPSRFLCLRHSMV